MAYMNKKLRHYVELSEKRPIPNSFEKFIDKHKAMENLILKKGNTCYCTHCRNEFTSNVKVGKQVKCPYCRHKYLVKRFTLKNYETKKDLILLDKVDNNIWMLRVFELQSKYNHEFRNFNYSCTEYRRVFFDDMSYSEVVEGDNVFHTMGLSVVWHFKRRTCWKKKEWSYYYQGYSYTVGYIFPNNIKRLLKGTKYQYCQLWKLVTKVDPFDLVDLFQRCLNDYFMTFELLVKLRLYNLSLCSNRFGSTKKTFEERFGVPKYLLGFMQRNNITYEELDVLRACKIPNIRLLKALQGCHNLLWLSYRIDFLIAWRKGLLSYSTEHEYKDYLQFAIQLGYDMKDKKILYPDDLREAHDKLQKLLEVCRKEANNRLMKERYEILKNNIYKTKKFIIYPASSGDELVDESMQQNNCVKSYIERVALSECDIYFMRLNSDREHSLVTVEVRNNKVVQAKTKYNNVPTKEQWNFLKRWEQRFLQRI